MGWTALDESRHANDVINEQLFGLRATKAHLSEASLDEHRHDLTQGFTSPRPIRVWFTALVGGVQDAPIFTGVILITAFDEDLTFDPGEFTRPWAYTIITLSEGPRYYDCPAEYLKDAMASSALIPNGSMQYIHKWMDVSPNPQGEERATLEQLLTDRDQ